MLLALPSISCPRWVWLLLCATMVSLTSAPAHAQANRRARPAPAAASESVEEASGAPAAYNPAITNALREFELQNYAEARSGFREAHRLYPNARTFRALGMVEFELKNYAAAVEYLEQALNSTERPLSDAQRGDVEQLLHRSRGYVGRFRVSIRPPSAIVLVDGSKLSLDLKGLLVLPVGEHSLDAEADGHRPVHRALHVVGGEEEALDVVLLPNPVVPQEEQRQRDAPVANTPVYKKWWLWTTIGVVIAAGAATGIVLGLRKDDPGGPSGGNTGAVLTIPTEMSSRR